MYINTEWYRIFLSVSKTKNLTKAAEQLHITQPSVSYAIKQLEQNLGVVLLTRLSKGVQLTQEGQMLAEYVEKAFHHFLAAENSIHLLKQFKMGCVRIGSNGAIIKDIILPVLDEFHIEYPDIRIQLLQAQTSVIVDHIKEGKLDVGFVYHTIKDSDIVITPLKRIENCFVAGGKFKSYANEQLTIQQLASLPLILLSSGSTTRRMLDGWFAAESQTIRADFELSSVDMMVEFAKRGYGIAFVMKSMVQNELANGELVELNTVQPLPMQELCMVTSHNNSLIANIFTKKFVD